MNTCICLLMCLTNIHGIFCGHYLDLFGKYWLPNCIGFVSLIKGCRRLRLPVSYGDSSTPPRENCSTSANLEAVENDKS